MRDDSDFLRGLEARREPALPPANAFQEAQETLGELLEEDAVLGEAFARTASLVCELIKTRRHNELRAYLRQASALGIQACAQVCRKARVCPQRAAWLDYVESGL